MNLCNAPTVVHGAYACPREEGHAGVHYWWIPYVDGRGLWRVDVYAGEPEDRKRLCRGVFTSSPRGRDVLGLLHVVAPLKKVELANRTPASEPVGSVCRPLSAVDTRCAIAA